MNLYRLTPPQGPYQRIDSLLIYAATESAARQCASRYATLQAEPNPNTWLASEETQCVCVDTPSIPEVIGVCRSLQNPYRYGFVRKLTEIVQKDVRKSIAVAEALQQVEAELWENQPFTSGE